MERNHTMMQFFEWQLQPDGNHWKKLKEMAPELKEKGIDSIWIPPVTKGQSAVDTGYSVYDLYDLGEFEQKGTVRTKYGLKEELLAAIKACQEHGVAVYVDLVMNHKAGADEKEVFKVIEVDKNDRNKEVSKPFDIEGWTKFTFPGRGDQYSDFKWNFGHFNGTDYDAKQGRTGVFRILGDNKTWNEHVDSAYGNYDYLMFANIDYNHAQVREEMIRWGKWLANTLACNGFRLDAIKHINRQFVKDFVIEVVKERGEDFFVVGEFWNSEPGACQKFLESVDNKLSLFDVSLHYSFNTAAQVGKAFDLTKIFHNSLVATHPLNAVTFVDNHDSQPGQALESWVGDWFKQSAYSLILLRQDGYPCVFYGDYYGIGGQKPIEGKKSAIDPLLYARYHKAYGEQQDYFDHPNTIGWVRRGVDEIERSGCAVVIANGDDGEKRMLVGVHHAGEIWVDFTKTREGQITIEKDGFATFSAKGGSVSVWAQPDPQPDES